jgi:hypothetical protein
MKIIVALFKKDGTAEIFDPVGVCMNGNAIQIGIREEDSGKKTKIVEHSYQCMPLGESINEFNKEHPELDPSNMKKKTRNKSSGNVVKRRPKF